MKGIWEEFIKHNLETYHKGTIVKMKDIGRKGKLIFKLVKDRFYCRQSNLPQKVFFIDKLKKLKPEGRIAYRKFWHNGDIEYRLGYYVISQYGKRKGHWMFGQYNPIMPLRDLEKIL
ncbi:MAG: hypothetical protein WC518_00130 [Patescibacteria group bacterium]